MRLNDLIPDTNRPSASDAQSLLNMVLNVATQALAVDIPTDLSGPANPVCRDFFEKYYVKSDNNGKLRSLALETPISLVEADIINFSLSDASKSQPFLLVDHAGRGKTTILKYLSYHLYHQEPKLQGKLLPLYISLRPYETTILGFAKATDVHVFLRQLVKERAFSVAYKYFLENATAILSWTNEVHQSPFQGVFPPKRVRAAEADPAEFIADMAERDMQGLVLLIISVLCHYSIHRLPVVLFLDDADNFPIDIQRAVLDFAKQKISLGLRVLVALRVSTWRSLESDRRDYEPHVAQQRINWSLDQLKALLRKRLGNAQQSMLLQTRYRADIQKQEIVNRFIDILSTDKSADFLIKTSNYNLHSLMRKLALMPHSWHFDDRFLLREHLITHTPSRAAHGVPLWQTFSLILGSYRGSFQSNDDVARSGIVNLFCTRDDKHEPYTFFVRVHILARLRDATTEASAVSMKTVHEEYREIFGESLSFSRVFRRTLYRLVQAGLVVTKSCRRYQSVEEVREHIDDDAVFISEAGMYYLCWLLGRIDYFYFMKDDIDWPDKFSLSEIECAKVGAPRIDRYRNALQALKMLMKLEFEMLSEIQDHLRKPGDARVARTYVTFFSGKRTGKGGGDVLFTRNMADEYRAYLNWSFPDYAVQFSNEFLELDELLTSHSRIRRAFR
jgi:hypothetical protein